MALAAVGCSSARPGDGAVTVQVALAGDSVPKAVDVHVFDAFGLVGSSHVAPAKMPGQLTITGLAAGTTETLRVVAVADAATGHLLGGARVDIKPTQHASATVTLSATYADADVDDVPDDLDGCPMVADPLQENATGVFPNDACRPDGGGLPGADMAGSAGGTGGTGGTGGAGGTGGSGGAAPADMAVVPAPADMAIPGSNCANVNVKLCDGFESATLGSVWSTAISGGSATIDTTRYYRGKSSLKLHNNQLSSGSADVEVYETTTFPSSHFYTRAFVYVPSTFSLAQATFLFTEENATPYDGITLSLLNGSFQTDNTLGNVTKDSTTKMPTNAWVCVEWEVQTGSSGFTNLLINGAAANGLGGTQNLTAPGGNPIAQFGMSLIASGTIAARDLWIDEIIVDTAPIGCTK